MEAIKRRLWLGCSFALAFVSALVLPAVAQAQIVVTPAVAVDDYIEAAVTALTAIVTAAIVGFFTFKVVKMGLRWVGWVRG